MAETLPQHLVEHCRRTPHDVALRERIYGIWHALTWERYLERVKRFCLGLVSLGLEPEHTVAIIGDNRPEWMIAELAAQSAGARSVGIYQDAAASEMLHIIAHADAAFIVVEDQEQVDKVLEIWAELEGVRRVVYYDPKGLRSYEQEFLVAFTHVEELGEAYEREHPGWFEDRVAAGKGSDTAILSTTSGTTTKPKLAVLSHANLLSMAANLMTVDPIEAGDEFVSFLPLAWIGEQMMSVVCGLQQGFVVNFPEKTHTVQNDIREIAPRVMFSPPRIWENLVSQVEVQIADSTRIKRIAYRRALAVGRRVGDLELAGETVPALLRARSLLARWLVFRPILSHLGMNRLRRAYTGGAALGPDVFRFFHALGVNLKQIYGQTEVCGIAALHRDGDIKFQTVGTPIPETELRVADNGEILLRSPAVMQGYYKSPEATAAAIAEDGWLRTGDAGYVDDAGHLVVIDRASDVVMLADGTPFSPQFIENKLKFSPHVKEAVVFFAKGERPSVTAMVNIDFENVGKWAERTKLAYTTYTDLAQKEAVYALVSDHIRQANADLPELARIRRFLLLHKELDADDAELTRTRKVRRGLVAERYADIIAALAGDADHLDVATTITYQDGRESEISTRLRIETL